MDETKIQQFNDAFKAGAGVDSYAYAHLFQVIPVVLFALTCVMVIVLFNRHAQKEQESYLYYKGVLAFKIFLLLIIVMACATI